MMTVTSDLPLRIVLVDPPGGVMYCLQRTSRADCVDHKRSNGTDVVFNVTAQVKASAEEPDFRGPFVQGRRGERYIAILIGTLAGDADSCWTRAAKIRLEGITSTMIEAVRSHPDMVLAGRFAGSGRGGGPACAT